MWIVRLALRRPYTFVVMALAILLLGIVAVARMPADVFPDINIPIVSAIWTYSGVSPEEMADVVTTRSERGFTTGVNDIEHMESQSLAGLSVIKIYFHPNAKIDAAVAQVSAQSNSILSVMPTGLHAPSVIRYNAASVPILQLDLSSDTLSEGQVYDIGYNFLRTQLANTQGASFPLPYGGKPRQIMVDLNPQAMYARGLSASDVANALNSQSLILPTGSAKIGTREYRVELNNAPRIADAFNDLPVKTVNGATIYLRDVAQVRDGSAVQTNIVRHDGRRGAVLTVLKNGDVSTIEIVKKIKEALPRILSSLPPAFHVTTLFDQSIFVKAAIAGVIKEAIAAAVLTGLMIMLFLGSWRSTLIVCISIPLSILTSLAVLYALGETVNIMTLGGLALAVGILVDDATVEIENIHRNLGMGKGVVEAILDGARQIAVPAFVSTLCICIVFVPVVFLTGAAKYLFTPLAMAVVIAMAASYLLSRTLVPTMIRYLIPAELRLYQGPEGEADVTDAGLLWSLHHAFHRGFERMRDGYAGILASTLAHRKLVLVCFVLVAIACAGLYPFIGADFFPQVDAGQIRLHVRCPGGTRVEETEKSFAQVEDSIRRIIPPDDLATILDNIGLPYAGYNLAFSDTVTLGPADGEILVSLRPGNHRSTWDYVREMRRRLSREFPDLTFFFQPADMVGQILNFGMPAPIDVQVVGPLRNLEKNHAMAEEIARRITKIPGSADAHVHQVNDVPMMKFDVDRTRAGEMGLSQLDVANGLLISLSSSSQLSPNWWVNPSNGVDYPVVVQTPTYRMDTPGAILNTPIHSNATNSTELLSNMAQAKRMVTTQVVNHYNVQPLYDVYANVQDRDLGGVARDIDRVLDELRPKLAPGSFFEMRGQVGTMRASFTGMAYGLVFAILLVYFVMVVNFQSWTDPFIVLMAVPGALAGILLMLFFSRTTVSVPALMGAIMSIGVGTANSILLVVFANDLRREGADALTAAYEAGRTRLRPVVMTAVAMLVGMIPMAMGLGEGGEQNAPLGRAVIGGLLFATTATLFIVPVVYSMLRKTPPKMFDEIEATD
ncbi:MAG TPA: efflux RND transporter permease subunit [Bryobacteraceae bacterium]|nr:efflux RND transporter permease subunit [Bryobacteraceae bacterium]